MNAAECTIVLMVKATNSMWLSYFNFTIQYTHTQRQRHTTSSTLLYAIIHNLYWIRINTDKFLHYSNDVSFGHGRTFSTFYACLTIRISYLGKAEPNP